MAYSRTNKMEERMESNFRLQFYGFYIVLKISQILGASATEFAQLFFLSFQSNISTL